MKDPNKMAAWMRKQIIEMAYHAGKNGAHLGSALSCVEILSCLYGQVMDVNPENIMTPAHDIFIPSKAHCVLSYYAALAYCSFFSPDDLLTFEDNLGFLPGHPVRCEEKGIEFSGGSLGMGLSQGVGMALGIRKKHLSQKVFVLLGDGECDEGSNWEAAQAASHFQLNNLIVIVDANRLQYDGYTSDIMNLLDLRQKFESFGFYAVDADGHNTDEFLAAFDTCFKNCADRPVAIIAQTTKGKGISFMENQKQWHHAVLSQKDYEIALNELGANYGA